MRGASRAVGIGVLLLALVGLFGLSVLARQDRFGNLQGRGHEWLTGSAIKFTRNWYREGAWNLRFAMLENPRSIEFPDLRSRQVYVSYPVGCLLPVYAVSLATRHEPSPALVMSVNLANQLLGAVAVFVILFLALRRIGLGAGWRAAFGALGFLFYVFLPGPFYWLQNVYFSDQAIILVVLMLVLLEVLHDRRPRPGFEIAEALVIGWGVFTDWFMVPVAATLLVRKWTSTWRAQPAAAKLRRSLLMLAPSALALLIFVIQVASLDGFANLQHKLLNRTGLTPGTPYHFSQLYDRFWLIYVPRNFGNDFAPWLITLTVVALAVLAFAKRGGGAEDHEAARLRSLSWLLLAPPIVHCLVFWQHSVDHSFTPLRFLPAFVCLPFAMVPLLVGRWFGISGRARTVLMGALLVAGLLFLGGRERMEGVERGRRPDIPAIGASLARLTTYEDLVFSPDLEVPANPPELLSYSMKRAYLLTSADSLAPRLAALPPRARIRVMFLQEPDAAWTRMLSGATPRDDGTLRAFDLGFTDSVRNELAARTLAR